VVEELTSLDDDGSGLRLGGTEPTAGGAGLFVGQELGLSLRRLFESAGRQTRGSGDGDLFHGVQIDIKPRPLLAESTPDDDFSPLFGQDANLLDVLVGQLAGRHSASLIQLAPMVAEAFPQEILSNPLCPANQCLHPGVDCPSFVSLLYTRSRYDVIMNLEQALTLALDPSRILLAQGLSPDPWQRDFLLGADKLVLLNCSRQSGKSTTGSARRFHCLWFRASTKGSLPFESSMRKSSDG
jgi:hypothetical protein